MASVRCCGHPPVLPRLAFLLLQSGGSPGTIHLRHVPSGDAGRQVLACWPTSAMNTHSASGGSGPHPDLQEGT